jgi:hypothetical protein
MSGKADALFCLISHLTVSSGLCRRVPAKAVFECVVALTQGELVTRRHRINPLAPDNGAKASSSLHSAAVEATRRPPLPYQICSFCGQRLRNLTRPEMSLKALLRTPQPLMEKLLCSRQHLVRFRRMSN